ncbi:MAG TPA: MATE family efflux transporter [Flavobacterium sp.]|nr:MATE family efflux transporter [Flavobacterium sp.]
MDFTRYTKEFSYNMRLAYPVILGMLGHTLIQIVDKLMVGRLGTAELAAVSLGNSFIFIAMSLGIGFSTAITPIVAEADAEKDYGKVRSAFHHGLFLCTMLGISLFALVFFSKPLMYAMGQPPEVIALAIPYLDWVAFSLIPMVVYQGYKQFADGLSMTKYSMYAIVMSNIIHIPINYVLIYGVWIFPEMGIVGAAVGTVISRFAMLIFMHVILARQKQLVQYFAGFQFDQIKKSMLSKIINLGTPSAMQMWFEVALFTAAVWLCGNIGKSSQAANEIALSLATITFMFAMGMSVTAMIRVSNQKGLNDYRQLIVVARSIFLLAILLETIFAIFFIAFHNFLPQFFLNMNDETQALDNAEVIAIAAKLLLVAAVFQISDGIQVVVLGALRGLQDVKIPMYITFVAYWVIGFPISFYLGKYTELKAVGVWLGLLAGLTAAALFLYIRFNKLTRRLVVQNQVRDQSQNHGIT